jgi:hypothetical protein
MSTANTRAKVAVMGQFEQVERRKLAFSFRRVQNHLNAAGMPSAQGWDALREKYDAMGVDKDWTSFVNPVKQLQLASLSSGKTAVSVFEIGIPQVTLMAGRAAELLDLQSPFHARYPRLLADTNLAAESMNGKFIRRLVYADGSIALVACGKRIYRERVVLALTATQRAALGSFDQVIGVRDHIVQFFDRVVFRPSLGIVDIFVDQCCPGGLPKDQIESIQDYYAVIINNHFRSNFSGNVFPGRKNLFPLIQQFYDDPDGRVTELSHATSTNSIKHEKMRGKEDDLRSEEFHSVGLGAVDFTDIFAIKKEWPSFGGIGLPSIELPGQFSAASDVTPRLEYAIIDGCAKRIEVEGMVGKLH